MPLPKILEPILPTSPQLGDKHSCILSPVVPMSPPSNHFGNNNNLIDLTTAIDEEDQTINIEKEKQNNTEEKKQSIAIEEKKVATEVKQDIATEEDYKQEERIATTTVSAPVSRRASPIIDQHDNEILIDTTVHEDINQQKEESDGEFNDDDGKEHEYGYSTSTVIVMTSRDDLDEKEQKHDSQDTLVEDKQVKMRDFIEPIQVSTATPVKEETDNYAVETSFKKSTSSGSFRSRCIQVFRGIKMRTHTSEKVIKRKYTYISFSLSDIFLL
jgi:hypothetical protein